MKHFIKKKIFTGSGGKEKPKPKATILRPPDIGRFEVASSYSVAEIVDLISDGPIDGLVNQNGENITKNNLLQGIYLDNTPIESSTIGVGSSAETVPESNKLYSLIVETFNLRLKLFSDRIKSPGMRKGIFRDTIQNCFFNFESGGAFDKKRRFAANSFPWFMDEGQRTTRAFVDASEDGLLQPMFHVFDSKSSIEDWNNGIVISENFDEEDTYKGNFNQDINVCKHSLFIKNKSATQGTRYLQGSNNQITHQSFIEIHYMMETLQNEQSITQEFYKHLEGVYNEQSNSAPTRALAFATKEKIMSLWQNNSYLGQNLRTRKFDPQSPRNNDRYPCNFGSGTYSVNQRPNDKFFVIIKMGNNDWSQNDSNNYEKSTKLPNINNSIYIKDTQTLDTFSLKFYNPELPEEIKVHNFLIPKLCNGPDAATYKGPFDEMTGYFYGFIILEIPLTYETDTRFDETHWAGNEGKRAQWKNGNTMFRSYQIQRWFYSNDIRLLYNKYYDITFVRGNGENEASFNSTNSKYNYSNVLCEFKSGTEFQNSLKFFNNIYTDFEYNVPLYGATRYGGAALIRRITPNEAIKNNVPARRAGESDEYPQGYPAMDAWTELTAHQQGGLVRLNSEQTRDLKETSSDFRGYDPDDYSKKRSYSNWNRESLFSESETPIVHTIENPNVTSVYFTLGISSLKDTINRDVGGTNGALKAGDGIPAILTIDVVYGKIQDGLESVSQSYRYTIIAHVESQTLIDFGKPEAIDGNTQLNYVLLGDPDHIDNSNIKSANRKFIYNLPRINENDDVSKIKRFIRITKVSVETNSVLISRDCSLVKVTEIIDSNLSYPFSAICGLKLDSRSFGSVPDRSYDCRLKRIKIPSNYRPLSGTGSDRRYIKDASKYTSKIKIYDRDWNGKLEEGWTDNPAWILYDLLTSKRYGLGGYIDESQINIWELYKIGRFCDSVDDEGYFIGVPDGIGGLEPRYSCNILFKDNIKIFDAINIVSNLFRGATFFSNSEIHFLDDRPRTPIAFFSNSNVKDGFFSYTNNRRDQQFNTVEVVYLDRFDNFKTKVEFVEDETNLRKRGVLKTTINTMGVTSRAMARRIGKHIIHQTINENQSVEFRAGLESLLCRPGDLIIVEDEMKTRETNYGKVLSIDLNNKSLYIEGQFSAKNYNAKLTVYTPTGYTTNDELLQISTLNRSRIEYFNFINDNPSEVKFLNITGRYSFDKYTNGYTGGEGPEYFAMYTGFNTTNQQKLFCYYNTGVTGWVFATGKSFADNNIYDKIISNTGIDGIEEINTSTDFRRQGFEYDSAIANRRGTATSNLNDNIIFDPNRVYNAGILNSEISTINYPQIKTFNVTGFDNQDYGSNLYLNTGDPNINLLQFVKAGSPYRIERTGASDQIYKILSIREENQNEYNIVASKYDTGKYELIENYTAIDYLPDTYYAGNIKVSNYQVEQLQVPYIDKFVVSSSNESSFDLSGVWQLITKATGYEVNVYNSLAQISQTYTMPTNLTRYVFKDLGVLGTWTLKVKALGDNLNLNSDYSSKDCFVLYQGITTFDRPAVNNFTIL